MNKIKICLDAGHGGKDPGAVNGSRYEKNDVLTMVKKVGNLLETNGVQVCYIRTGDIYESPSIKKNKISASGADIAVSFHRNAAANSAAAGVEVLLPGNPGELHKKTADSLLTVFRSAGFRDRGTVIRTDLAVLKATVPVVLLEAGFLTNAEDNERIDRKFSSLCSGIAKALLTITGATAGSGGSFESGSSQQTNRVYRVQCGAFSREDNAKKLKQCLQDSGFDAVLVDSGGMYKVQAGAFQVKKNAQALQKSLKNRGFDAILV